MPSFRGVDVFITAIGEAGIRPLEEYPHPESSSATPDRVAAAAESEQDGETSQAEKQETAAAARPRHSTAPKQDSRISVYIASQPYARFSVDYKITLWPPTPPGASSDVRYLFFKVFMNGRREVAWGIDLEKNRRGSTGQALYSPGKLYEYTDEQGRTMIQPGIEARRFVFLPQDNKTTSVASEGGLIEVQVFRSYGRTRRAPNPLPYRSHENYGVALMTDGLVSKPEENRYYSYSLADPSDSPYAAFRFHYRSWANLNDLQIVSQDEPQGPVELTGSTAAEGRAAPRCNPKLSRPWEDMEEFGCHLSDEERMQKRQAVTCATKTATVSRTASSRRSSEAPTGDKEGGVSGGSSSRLDDDSIFDDSEDDGAQSLRSNDPLRGRSSTGESYYYLKSPPQLRPPALISGDRIPQPSKAVRDRASQDNLNARPLPDLPVPDLPSDAEPKISATKRQSSTSSGTPSVAASVAASIAPSLLPYVEGDAFTTDFEYTAVRRADLEKGRANEIEVGAHGDSPSSSHRRATVEPSGGGYGAEQAPADGPWAGGGLGEGAPGSSDYGSSTKSPPSSDDEYQYPPREFAPPVYYSLCSPGHRFASMPSPSTGARRGSCSAGGSLTGAGKVSPKAKQLLGEELDYSSSFATLADPTSLAATASSTPPASEGRRSGGSTLRASEAEWARSGGGAAPACTPATATPGLPTTAWSPPGSGHQRRPSRGSFLSKLWSPRLRSSNSAASAGNSTRGDRAAAAASGDGEPDASQSPLSSSHSSSARAPPASRGQAKKTTGSSLVVGLGGYVL
ncbi:hypothetical protein GGTG_07961 [Gaeumannomyces tritici R3-111a-1]|uniref:Uncharacterized protein n=1 Tax=Gaeumannomyces tritici (strain R3-111a-1) TaxID=644352 RepID=J3P371_GAET3|nr:hypothetical protein GGTG_07961 [Gaeumannomyces tritici R3-111a-1]EJT74113.1 hypothetical protein GGTG_07961 [Gaeumannomyces tritici R3-111a-1]